MKKIFMILTIIILATLLVSCKSKNNTNGNNNVQIYTRDTTSGTREAFFTSIDFTDANKDDSVLANSSLIVDGNGDMITKIRNDQNGIGYISLSSYNNNDVSGLLIDGIEPNETNVLDETYTLTRNFNYIITKNKESDADKLAYVFQAYLNTLDAKLIIKSKGGIVDINDNLVRWESIKNDYPITLEDNSKTTLIFGGSTSVESIGKALSIDFSIKAGNFKSEHNYIGSSAAFKSTQGKDSDGSNLIHIGFLSRNFNSNEQAIPNTSGILSIDAIVAIVNKENDLTSISKKDLKNLYNGTYLKFSEVINYGN